MFIPYDEKYVGASVVYNQRTISVTNTAVPLTTSRQPVKNGVIVQALAGNTGKVYLGGSSVTTANGYELQAGQPVSVAIDDISKVYINGTASDGVCYITTV